IRDIPSLLALAPWYGKKHRDNTLTMKRFTNGRGFWCLGGKAAKNYREKSVDVAGYDELAAFDDDIEQEGSPTFLGDKRIEGSVWPKSIRGSTPKVRGTCQIERAASESPHFMRFHVACPHCGEEQYLKFGDKETPFGLKWTPDDPSSVFYLCEHNACVIRQQELDFTDARYICEKTGIWTRDGILWFSSSGEEIEPPDSVTFHIWTAYSPFTTWVQIVKDWMKTKGDTGKRKTFVNTTLGETWEAKIGERPDAEVMAERKEHYSAPVPDRVAYLTAGIDSQLDRYEMRVWGWGPGEESWLIDRQIIMGRHDDEQTLLRVDEAINKTYTRRNGAEMSISRICWDTGGIDPTIVYERSKKHGLFRVIPIKGASVYGKPVASMPRKRNKNGVYLTEIGTDTAKEQIYNRFTLTPEGDEPLPGAVHFPNNPDIRFDKYDGSATTFLGDAYIDTQTLEINMTGGAASRITARVRKDEATGWIFAEATIQAIDGELKIGSQIQYSPKQGGATVSGDYIYLATPQVENGPCVSSFIISGTTAATRASDIVTVPIKNNLYNLPFTVLCEVHKNWYKTPNAAPRVFDTGGHQTGAAIILGFGSSADYDGFPYCDIGGANRRVNENALLEKMVMGMRVKSDQSTCSVSNGRISSQTKTTWSCIQNTAIIRIGGQTTAGLRHLFGHVRNFRIWHKALTDAQVGESI
ncbi:TPA: phage terminase large subunit family protein, partial [Escherichia coli]